MRYVGFYKLFPLWLETNIAAACAQSNNFELFFWPAHMANNSIYMADRPATTVYHVKS